MIDRHIKRLDKSIADLKKLGELAQQTFMLTIQLEALVEMGKSDFLAEYFSDWAQVSNSLLRFWSKSNHMIAQSTDAQGLPFGATSACQVAVVINETLMTLLSVTASLDKLKKPVPRGFLLNKDMLTSRLRDVWKRNSIRYYHGYFALHLRGGHLC